MILVSSRRNFTDTDNIHDDGHLIREVDLTTDKAVQDLNETTLESLITGKKVCILVHGYNNEYYEVCDAYEIIENQLKRSLPGAYDIVIGYCWPGGNRKLEWWDAKSRANAVARKFRQLLELCRKVATTIDLISHSLGARVSLKALKESANKLIDQYYCMAAAVDNECLEPGEEFSDALTSVNTIHVMHSARDDVLSTAYRLAEFDNALGLFGPEDKSVVEAPNNNIYVANCKRVVENHGGYKRNAAVFGYIAATKMDSPKQRFVTL